MTSPGAASDDARLAALEEAARLQTNLLADVAAGRPVDPAPVLLATAAALAALGDAGGRELDARTREALRHVHALNGAITSAIDDSLRETGRRIDEVRRASRLASDLDARDRAPRRDWIA